MAKDRSRLPLRLGLVAGLVGAVATVAAGWRRRTRRQAARHNAAFDRASAGLWPPSPRRSGRLSIGARRAAAEQPGGGPEPGS